MTNRSNDETFGGGTTSATAPASAREMADDERAAFVLARKWGVLSVVHDGLPYAVPVAYGFDGLHFYLASGPGRKLDSMLASPGVCLTIPDVTDGALWSCVVVRGHAVPQHDLRSRLSGLNAIRRQQTGDLSLSPKELARAARAAVFRLTPVEISGRVCTSPNGRTP